MRRTDPMAMVVTVSEAARLLGISRTHAYELVERGELAHVRLGRRIVVPKHALEALLGAPVERRGVFVNAGVHVLVGRDRVVLEVGVESDLARRELGPVAWSVLETLALAGEDCDGGWVTTTNARDLAGRLGIGKDRAASALSVLRRAGLVAPRLSRDAATSRFAASSYEVLVPVSRDGDTPPQPVAPSPSSETRARRRREVRRDDDTLDLFSSAS